MRNVTAHGDGAVLVDGLTVRYGDLVAVKDVSFTAAAGSITAVLGPNGAGKTSTIEVCEGFRRASSGTVRVLGLDPAVDQARLSERMGVMLQDGGPYPSARVRDTVRHYCQLYQRGVDPQRLIEQVGLADRTRSTYRRLSGGEKQRLSLALALAARPEVAFLDEPTSGVDVLGRDTIRTIIRSLAADGCAVVLATHELDEAERLADRVVIFDRGEVIADGTLDELRRGHDEIRFRSSPDLDLLAMAMSIGFVVSRVGADEYVVDAPPHPRLMAQLAGWLGDQGHPLHDVRAGAQRLEDVFRRLTAADADGMMVSMIQSNYESFGSGVVAAGTGIALQNRGAGFVSTPGHPNQVGPRKRPRPSILPAFVTRGDQPVMSFGVMGTTMQPQGHVQVLARIADHGQNPQAACDGPRFRWMQGMQVAVEDGFPPVTVDELRGRGHEIVSVSDYSAFGACQAIWRLDDGYLAVSDPRKDGQAVGF